MYIARRYWDDNFWGIYFGAAGAVVQAGDCSGGIICPPISLSGTLETRDRVATGGGSGWSFVEYSEHAKPRLHLVSSDCAGGIESAPAWIAAEAEESIDARGAVVGEPARVSARALSVVDAGAALHAVAASVTGEADSASDAAGGVGIGAPSLSAVAATNDGNRQRLAILHDIDPELAVIEMWRRKRAA